MSGACRRDDDLDLFLIEIHAGLASVEDLLLDGDGAQLDAVGLAQMQAVFTDARSRAAHLGFERLSALLEEGEVLFSQAAAGNVDGGTIDRLAGHVEVVREILRSIEADGQDVEMPSQKR